MVIRMQHKPFAICVALATAVFLTAVSVALESAIPRGTVLGFAAQFVCLGVVIAALLVGFNFVCDQFDEMTAKRKRRVYDQPRRKPTVLTYRGITHSGWSDEPVATASRSLSSGTGYGRRVNRERISANGQPAPDGQPAANGSPLHDVVPGTRWWVGQ